MRHRAWRHPHCAWRHPGENRGPSFCRLHNESKNGFRRPPEWQTRADNDCQIVGSPRGHPSTSSGWRRS